MIKKYWKIAAAAAFMAAAGICYVFLRTGGEIPVSGSGAEFVLAGEEEYQSEINAENANNSAGENGKNAENFGENDIITNSENNPQTENDIQETESMASLFVHICGEVKNPGVYELPEGSRAFEAVEAAGGYTENAAEDSLNLAALVQDGMKLTVPSMEEAEGLSREELGRLTGQNGEGGSSGGAAAGGAALVNINTAGAAELMTLSGIGESRAEDIIRYRTEHGGFQNIEEIMKVPGIKDAMFQKIKDSITV